LSVLTYTYLYYLTSLLFPSVLSSPPSSLPFPSSDLSSFPIFLPYIHSILVGTYIYLFIFNHSNHSNLIPFRWGIHSDLLSLLPSLPSHS
jgi:hypothetical protein